MPLPYGAEELEGSPIVEIEEDGTSATRLFRLPNWDEWRRFARDLIGHYLFIGDVFYFVRPIEFPGFVNLIVSRIRVEPLDPQHPVGDLNFLRVGTNQYPDAGAKLSVHYKTVYDTDNQQHPDNPKVPRGTYLSYRVDLSTEVETIPGRSWVYDIGGAPPLPDDIQPKLIRPSGGYTLTWHRVIRPPWSAIRLLRGKLNSASFLGAAPGTVLFLGARMTRQFQFLETGGFWEIRYSFAEDTKKLKDQQTSVGWNYFPRRSENPGDENWAPIRHANSSPAEPPYQSGDFNLLFQFE